MNLILLKISINSFICLNFTSEFDVVLLHNWLDVLISRNWLAGVDTWSEILKLFLIADRCTESRRVYAFIIDMSRQRLPWQVGARCVNPDLLTHKHNRLTLLLRQIGRNIIVDQVSLGWPRPRLVYSRPWNWLDSVCDGWWLVSLKQRRIILNFGLITNRWG